MDNPLLAKRISNLKLFTLALLLPLLGILMATVAAKTGQRASRMQDFARMAQQQSALEQQLAATSDSALRAAITAEIARLEPIDANILSYHRTGRQFTHWDGYRYEEIIDEGYLYTPDASPIVDPLSASDTEAALAELHQKEPQLSESDCRRTVQARIGLKEPRAKNVVWYPLYPLLGAGVKALTGLPSHHALTLVSSLSILAASVLLVAFVRRHMAAQTPSSGSAAGNPDLVALLALICLLFGPCSVFLYANFTESLFVLLLIAFLYCVQRRRWWLAALVAAIASSSRSQGVLFGPILALVFLLRATNYRLVPRLALAVVLGFISGLGVLAYMIYLQHTFGDALAFMHAQRGWNVGINGATLKESLNPLRALSHLGHLLFELRPMDWPRIWEACCIIWPPIVLFFGRRRLSLELAIVGWMLWALPYVSSSLAGNPPGATKWMSMGRFMAVLIPAQLIAGAWLAGGTKSRETGRGPFAWRWICIPLGVMVFIFFAYKYGSGEWVG